MQSSLTGRRSSVNPVRVLQFDRDEKGITKPDSRRIQLMKPKISVSGTEGSQIPRPRLRASSSERVSSRSSLLKGTGKTPLRQYTPQTANTPVANNPKLSIGYATNTTGNKVQAGLPTGRRSLSADRASNVGTKGSRKDTRPLTEKGYQNYMLSKVDEYFAKNHWSYMLNTNGSLKPITLKIFVEVSAFLVKILDGKQVVTNANYIEELPKIAKKFHYPGVITKSWLKTANAMHSWPSVLGWLAWLVEVCEVKELAQERFTLECLPFMDSNQQAGIHKKALLSMLSFYNAWNDEKLDEEAALVEKYLLEIETQQGVNEEGFEKAHFELDEALMLLQAAEEESNKIDDEVKQLKDVVSSLQIDEMKQLADIKAKEEYMKAVNVETDQVNAECNVLYEQIRSQTTRHDELVLAVKQQPISRAERDHILEKCTAVQNYIYQFEEHLQDIQKEVYSLDIKLAVVRNDLNKSILAYNKEILIRFSTDLGVDLEEMMLPEGGNLQPHIMDVMNAKAHLMDEFRESLQKQLSERESSIERDTNHLEALQDKIRALEDEANDIAEKLKEKKAYIGKMKGEAKSEETRLKEQIRRFQDDIRNMEDSMPDLRGILAQLEDAKDKLGAVRRRNTLIGQNAKRFFDEFYKILGEHRNELYNILKKARVSEADR